MRNREIIVLKTRGRGYTSGFKDKKLRDDYQEFLKWYEENKKYLNER